MEQLIPNLSLIANKSDTDNRSIKKAQTKLPSFPKAKWADFTARAGLPEEPYSLRLKNIETTVY